MINTFDRQYINIMKRILTHGVDRPDRTGIGSRAIWGAMVDVDLADGFPIVTTRKTSFRIAFEETWFFLRGETDTKKLEDKNIFIWKGNTSREFLDGRGLSYLPEGHLGKGYGYQWRNFGGDGYEPKYYDYVLDKQMYDYDVRDNTGVDQVINVLNGLKSDPNGRRHIISGWNPQQLNEMALPPCHLYNQYQILNGKLNSSFVMRSHDWLYGGPFNFMGYALLNIAFAKYLKLEPGHLTYFGNDVHIYDNQIDIASQQIKRKPYKLPKIMLNKTLNTIDDIFNIEYQDFIFTTPYKAHPDFKNKPKMAI